MITIEKFMEEVTTMRTKQNEHARVKSPETFRIKRQAEAIVDNRIRKFYADQQQLSLFH